MIETASPEILPRQYDAGVALQLYREGTNPLLARILASRGIISTEKLDGSLKYLHHHSVLKGARDAAVYLADKISQGAHFLIVADYDCDGATACAVGLRGLRNVGATVDFIVPDRMIHGYGLTPSVVSLAKERFPGTQVLITVDNGVASHAGVDAANALGLEVVVTDHHLPSTGKPLPAAKVIVDPSQVGCLFPSKALAGVGVIWYVLWALQDELRARGRVIEPAQRVSTLLPLVAVGTVADVVPLDENNRILVQAGLDRIRQKKSYPGIEALATVGPANRTQLANLVTTDIAFGIGPRINAAGRLQTMDVGIECLTTDNPVRAQELAKELFQVNHLRKDIQDDTVIDAVEQAEKLIIEGSLSITVNGIDWHPGVIGIVAGRIKERRWRPTFVLTTDPETGELKGSGRSIPGFNLKDALDQVDKACPGLMPKFGGHAMAAGVSLRAGGFEQFRDAFEVQALIHLNDEILNQRLDHDGSLTGQELCPETIELIKRPPWGQMFLEPSFCDLFEIVQAKIAGVYKNQLNLIVERDGVQLRATRFRHEGAIPTGTVQLVYKLASHRDKWGNQELRLLIDHISTV